MKKTQQINFLGIGMQKAGTTWLFNNLKSIPEFDLPPLKEIHYFDRDKAYHSKNKLAQTKLWKRLINPKYLYEAIVTLAMTVFTDYKSFCFYKKWFFTDYTDKWYMSLFDHFSGYKGEITPSYSILDKKDVERIYQLMPNVKLVLILRNPIERAWSHYRFKTRKFKNFNVENVNNTEIIKFLDAERQSSRSDYIRTLKNFSSVFPKHQLLICFFDAIDDNPKGLLNDIIKHITGKTSISTSHLNLAKRANKSRDVNCPKEIEQYLKNRYHDQIKELSELHGGYFTKWYQESYAQDANKSYQHLSPTIYM
ncbi:MAG: sulfotransferase domain-containing protein [Cyclobacteriaceae bacterium]